MTGEICFLIFDYCIMSISDINFSRFEVHWQCKTKKKNAIEWHDMAFFLFSTKLHVSLKPLMAVFGCSSEWVWRDCVDIHKC